MSDSLRLEGALALMDCASPVILVGSIGLSVDLEGRGHMSPPVKFVVLMAVGSWAPV